MAGEKERGTSKMNNISFNNKKKTKENKQNIIINGQRTTRTTARTITMHNNNNKRQKKKSQKCKSVRPLENYTFYGVCVYVFPIALHRMILLHFGLWTFQKQRKKTILHIQTHEMRKRSGFFHNQWVGFLLFRCVYFHFVLCVLCAVSFGKSYEISLLVDSSF